MTNRYVGSWQDSAEAATQSALSEVNVCSADYIRCEFSSGFRYEPLVSGHSAIDAELVYSESRQQWRAILRQLPAAL